MYRRLRGRRHGQLLPEQRGCPALLSWSLDGYELRPIMGNGKNSLPETPRSLYLHIPFCRHRCSYCDFNTYTSVGELKEAYATALSDEIRAVTSSQGSPPLGQPLHTVYFGGGTPSLMSPDSLAHIMKAVGDSFTLLPETEISLEANPGTVDASYLGSLRALGINRISLGLQSANQKELSVLDREHDFAAVIEAVKLCQRTGFTNLNLDLIYGVPGQTLGTWRDSLAAALALRPMHLSLYCLTIEPGTPMQRWLSQGRIQLPDPDLAADQYELAGELLAQHGFCQYEISNWALPGYECQHNLTYWRNLTYLGLGAGAHGQAAGYRYSVVMQPRVYIRRMQGSEPNVYPLSPAVAEKHVVGSDEAISDTVITQLRLLQEGLDLDAFEEKFGRTLDQAYPGEVARLVEWGLLEVSDRRLHLTPRGRFLSNQVFYRFM